MENYPLELFRNIGSYYDDNIYCVYQIDKSYYLITSNINSFKVLSLPDLKIVSISPIFENKITGICNFNDYVFISFDNKIIKMHYNHLIQEISFDFIILNTMILDKMLLVLGNNQTISLYESNSLKLIKNIYLGKNIKNVYHPKGYLNKMIFFSYESMFMINLNTEQVIFDFTSQIELKDIILNNQLKDIYDSSVADVVILVFNKGLVISMNLKTCEIYFKFEHKNEVTGICFSSLEMNKPRMFVSLENGNIFIWDLTTKTLERKHKNEMINNISMLYNIKLQNQDLFLVGSHQDNLLKIFRLDEEYSQLLNEVRTRQGMKNELRKIRFYQDRFVIGIGEAHYGDIFKFSIYNDNASGVLSTKLNKESKNINTELTRKCNDVVDFSFSNISTIHKNNLFTVHKNSTYPLFWDLENKTIKNVFLELKNEYREKFNDRYAEKVNKYRIVTALETSHCGNYLFVGYNDGLILKLSTQSGQIIIDFQDNLFLTSNETVNGIFSDSKNHYIVVATNSKIYKLDFFNGMLLKSIDLKQENINKVYFDRTLEILVVNTKMEKFLIYDVAQFVFFREIKVEKSEINDLTFLSFEKKIIICQKNKTLSIIDIFLGEITFTYNLIKEITSISYNSKLNLIATISPDQRNVTLWKTNNLFAKLPYPVNINSHSEIKMFPTNLRKKYFTSNLNNNLILKTNVKDNLLVNKIKNVLKSKTSANIYTLTDVKKSQWCNLNIIDKVIENNEMNNKMYEEVEQTDLPFYLEFDQKSTTTLINEDAKKPDQVLKVIKNNLIEEQIHSLNKTFNNYKKDDISIKKDSDLIFQKLRTLNSIEIDYFIINLLFEDNKNVINLLYVYYQLILNNQEIDFKLKLINHLLEVNL